MSKQNRLYESNYNNQGCQMLIIEYNNNCDIIVEFHDKYKCKVHTSYQHFKNGSVKNPYHQSVYKVGITGNKYPRYANGKNIKEYDTWTSMLQRCFDDKFKEKNPAYKDVVCCEEWLNYEVFYEWLHSQENFERWLNGNMWALDKDIIIKGNKVYSPETCCLVSKDVNTLFSKRDNYRGKYPIGVSKNADLFKARCMNPITGKHEYLGLYTTPTKAFYAYKDYKENLIKQIAQEEYNKDNITKKCYDAMMNYKVEITD